VAAEEVQEDEVRASSARQQTGEGWQATARCASSVRAAARRGAQRRLLAAVGRDAAASNSRGSASVAGSDRRARALVRASCDWLGVEPAEWAGPRTCGQALLALRYAIWLLQTEQDLPPERMAGHAATEYDSGTAT
jgi:hypothetical protein